MFCVYILQNPAGKFYIGQTDDLPARLHSLSRTDDNLTGSSQRLDFSLSA